MLYAGKAVEVPREWVTDPVPAQRRYLRGADDKLDGLAFNFFKRDRESPDTEAQTEQDASAAAGQAEGGGMQPRGFFERMKQAVTRTRETLAESISSVVALTREIDEENLEDLELVLLASDIGSVTTGEIITQLRERALRQGINDGAELKALLKAELRRILDSVARPIRHPGQAPEVIMMVGVNGTGKTTTTGKLAALHRAQGRTVLLCAADTFRAAAIEQLEVWSERSGVQVIKTRQGGDPSAALFDALTAAKARGTEILIVDTAGRLHTKSDLMKELDKMRRTAEKLVPGAPHQTLLVMDATTGQNGLQQARLFTEAAGVSGIVLTKLDGTAKGGIVIAIARELGLPVLYAGIGEKMEDILPFEPGAFVDSLLD
jgi:fused signal recognition particle receptor